MALHPMPYRGRMAAPQLVTEPPLPRGERVVLPGRGTTFVRRIQGPPGAPTVLLLHGWIASGGSQDRLLLRSALPAPSGVGIALTATVD